ALEQPRVRHLSNPAQRGGRGHAARYAQRGDRNPRLLSPLYGEIEQYVPGRIGKQLADDKACAQLAMANDPAQQPWIGQFRPARWLESLAGGRPIPDIARAFQAADLAVPLDVRRGHAASFDPPGQLPDLLRQTQQR